MKPQKQRIIILIAFISFLLGLFAAVLPHGKYLVFISNEDDALSGYVKLQSNEFQVKYIHSIHLTEVIESLEVLPDASLMMTEVEYSDFAVGMPSNVDEGEEFVQEDGKYFIRNMTTVLPEYRMFVGDIDEALLLSVDGTDYDLKKSLNRGASYTLRIEELSFLQKIQGSELK